MRLNFIILFTVLLILIWELLSLIEADLPRKSNKDDALMEKIGTDDIIQWETVSEDVPRVATLTKVVHTETGQNIGLLSLELWEPKVIKGASVGTFQGRIPRGEKRFGRQE